MALAPLDESSSDNQRQVHENHERVGQPIPHPLNDVQKALEATAALLCRFGQPCPPQEDSRSAFFEGHANSLFVQPVDA